MNRCLVFLWHTGFAIHPDVHLWRFPRLCRSSHAFISPSYSKEKPSILARHSMDLRLYHPLECVTIYTSPMAADLSWVSGYSDNETHSIILQGSRLDKVQGI
eukprot:GHVH01008738.1.p1 GENE.GHVH01008738.1~~GHVH01008738.1.p1  ORF type:complete len:102 (+),score=4.69 GHVH01008738.1:86-391(+)